MKRNGDRAWTWPSLLLAGLGACGGQTSTGGASASFRESSSTTTESSHGASSSTTTGSTCASNYYCGSCSVQHDSTGCGIGCLCASSTSTSNTPTVDSGCVAPPSTTYACAPQSADAGGCTVTLADGAAVSYPLGCVETLPTCSVFSNDTQPQTCSCTTTINGNSGFVCPL